MQIMSVTAEIDSPAREVWAIVSDFGGLQRWNGAVLSCTTEGTGVGTIRTFVTRGGTIREQIEDLNPDVMRLRYSILSGSSMKVLNAHLTIAMREIDASRSGLTWTLYGEPDGIPLAELAEQARQRYLGRINELRECLNSKRRPP